MEFGQRRFNGRAFDSATKRLRFLNHLNRAYRFVGQFFLWVTFGVVGAIVGFLVLPSLSLLESDRLLRQRRARAVIGGCFRWFLAGACTLGVISCRVTGTEHYKPEARQLILANHPSLIDVVILVSLFPQVECVIKGSVTRNPVLRLPAQSANYISNSDPAALLEACVERLASGGSLLLFPEGTRSVPGQPLQFKPGAAEIALRANATILPAVIECRPAFLAKQHPWYHVPARKPHFTIRVLPPVNARDLVPQDVSTKRARITLNTALQQLVEAGLS